MEFHSTDGFPETAIRLVSGEMFDYADPSSAVITLHDVGHALARTTRFAGHHTVYDWTVAHHTVLVATLVSEFYHGTVAEKFGALHHDDVEFVTSDWTSPMKRYLKSLGLDYKSALERPIEAALSKALGLVLDDLHAGVVKEADRLAFVLEGLALKPGFNPADQGFDDIDEDTIRDNIGFVEYIARADTPHIEAAWMKLNEKWGGEAAAQNAVIPPSPASELLDQLWALPPAPETPPES